MRRNTVAPGVTIFIGAMMLLLAAFSHRLYAQDEVVFTLEDSIHEAFAKNWSFRAQKERLVQARYERSQRRSDLLFRVNTDYAYTRFDDETTYRYGLTQEIPTSSKDNYQWRATLTQPVFTGFALLSAYDIARLGVDRSKMEIELARLDLALEVKNAYFGILIVDKAVEVVRKEVASLLSNVEVTKNFHRAGMIPINDLLKAELELANARNILVQAVNDARLARSEFNTLLSRPVDAPAEVEDILVRVNADVVFEKMIEVALANRPEMALIDNSIEQSEQQIRYARSGYYPEISMNYSFIKEGDKPDVSGSLYHDGDRWEAMAVASWSVWEWGKTYYAVQEQKSTKTELEKTRNAVQDNIILNVKEAMLGLETAEENIPVTRKAVEQGEENLRVNEESYKAQMTTITEVLDAQTLLTRARVNYYRALYDYHLAHAFLQRAVGTY
ncbi:MAG: TolC family protein [Desulfobacterales bacterium]